MSITINIQPSFTRTHTIHTRTHHYHALHPHYLTLHTHLLSGAQYENISDYHLVVWDAFGLSGQEKCEWTGDM